MNDNFNETLKYEINFYDNSGALQIVDVNIVKKQSILIKCKNEFGEVTGYVNIFFHPNNRIYLDTIYCYQKHRGKGIATNLSKIVDYLLREYKGYIIRGNYEPSQLSDDRLEKRFCSDEELEKRASRFYQSIGYQILSAEEFNDKQKEIDYLTIKDDFQLSEDITERIVFKKI